MTVFYFPGIDIDTILVQLLIDQYI
jgi:hypothetical protein